MKKYLIFLTLLWSTSLAQKSTLNIQFEKKYNINDTLYIYNFEDTLLHSIHCDTLLDMPYFEIKKDPIVYKISFADHNSFLFIQADSICLKVDISSDIVYSFRNSPINSEFQIINNRRKYFGKEAMKIYNKIRSIYKSDTIEVKKLGEIYENLRSKEIYEIYDLYKKSNNVFLKLFYIREELYKRNLPHNLLKEIYSSVRWSKRKEYQIHRECHKLLSVNPLQIGDPINRLCFMTETNRPSVINNLNNTYLVFWSQDCIGSVNVLFDLSKKLNEVSSDIKVLFIEKPSLNKTLEESITNNYTLINKNDKILFKLWQNFTPQVYYFSDNKMMNNEFSVEKLKDIIMGTSKNQ